MKPKRSNQPRTAAPRFWTASNGLSVLRLLMTLPVVLLLGNPFPNRWWVLLLGLVVYATDLADGWIARRFEKESELGRIIDPLADKVFVTGTILALAASGATPLWYVIVVIARDVLIFVSGMYLRARTGVLAQSNLLGKAAVVSVGLALVFSLFRPAVDEVVYKGLLVISLGLLCVSLYSYGERFFSLMKKSHARS